MSLLDSIISFIAPHYCLGCQDEGSLLCRNCQIRLKPAPSVCFRCLMPAPNYQTCDSCYQITNIATVWRVTPYAGLAKDLIWRLKFTGAQQAARDIAPCFAALHRPSPGTHIVPLPTATSRVRRRSYDQAVLLAKRYAKITGTSYKPCLARLGQQHQRGAKRQERLQQLAQAYRITRPVRGANILLVDDVATTGASLQAAAQALYGAGARSVNAIVFAQA